MKNPNFLLPIARDAELTSADEFVSVIVENILRVRDSHDLTGHCSSGGGGGGGGAHTFDIRIQRRMYQAGRPYHFFCRLALEDGQITPDAIIKLRQSAQNFLKSVRSVWN